MSATVACRLLRGGGATARRWLSTSGKRSDTAAATAAAPGHVAAPSETAAKATEDWVSYGFDYKDKTADSNYQHLVFFFSVSVVIMGGGFYFAYMPDNGLRDWASREAFLELRRREAAGLPPIDRNFIDPANIQLPSDEELGKTEIII